MKVLAAWSYPTFCDPMDCSPPGFSVHGDSPGKNTGVGCHALLQGIFPTQGSNPGLPHCRRILYRLNHQGSPHLFSCRNKMRKYRPHSAPVCLLVTLANWNLAQVHGAQTYRDDFIFLGSKVTADGDCSHEIKRCLLLRRKAMIKPDSILKKQRHHFAD